MIAMGPKTAVYLRHFCHALKHAIHAIELYKRPTLLHHVHIGTVWLSGYTKLAWEFVDFVLLCCCCYTKQNMTLTASNRRVLLEGGVCKRAEV